MVFLLLIFFLVVGMKKKPYQTQNLNDLEVLSIVVSMLTIFCGIFFIVNVNTTNSSTG